MHPIPHKPHNDARLWRQEKVEIRPAKRRDFSFISHPADPLRGRTGAPSPDLGGAQLLRPNAALRGVKNPKKSLSRGRDPAAQTVLSSLGFSAPRPRKQSYCARHKQGEGERGTKAAVERPEQRVTAPRRSGPWGDRRGPGTAGPAPGGASQGGFFPPVKRPRGQSGPTGWPGCCCVRCAGPTQTP